MPTPLEIIDFDTGLYLIGGQEMIPDGALRVSTGTNAIKTQTLRSRAGIIQLYSSIVPISLWKSLGHRYAVDNTGKIYRDGIVIYSNLHLGARVGTASAPPHFAAPTYRFVLDGSQTRQPIKIDAAGNVTNWGIAAPPDGMIGIDGGPLVSVSIDPMNATAGWTVTGGGTLSADTNMFLNSTASLSLKLPSKATAAKSTITKATAVNLAGTSPYMNIINLDMAIDLPEDVRDVVLDFDLGTNFTTDYYSYSIPIANLIIANAYVNSTSDLSQVDSLVSQFLTNPQFVPTPAIQSSLMNDYYQGLQAFYGNAPHSFRSIPSKLKPNAKSLQSFAIALASVFMGGNSQWWRMRIPQAAFTRYGKGNNTWANVTSTRITILNMQGTDQPTLHFNGLSLSGGTGIFGNVQYLVSFTNTTTGSYSQPNPNPVKVNNIFGNQVQLTSIPVSTDPQVNGRIIWRTVSNGGLFYKAFTIPDNTTTVANDQVSDFVGLIPGDNVDVINSFPGPPVFVNALGSLSLEALVQVNIVPALGLHQCAFLNGTMFLTNDGTSGIVYYSAVGYAEGVAGFTDVTHGDDLGVGFAIFNNNVYWFTQKGLWIGVSLTQSPLTPGWEFQQILAVPGCISPQSIQVTEAGIVYQAQDGLRFFNGYDAPLVLPQLMPLFRGETQEGYSLGTIVASARARGEYWFSDGSKTFAMDNQQRVRCVSTNGFSALYYEEDTGVMMAGGPNGWLNIEASGVTSDFDGGLTVDWKPKFFYAGEKYKYKVQRVYIDANTGGSALTVQLWVDGVSVTLPQTLQSTTRTVYECGANQTGRLLGIEISGTATGQVEIFKIALEVDTVTDNDRS